MTISFKTDSGDFGALNITGSNEAKFAAGLGASGDNYLERAYITGSDGSWIKLDNSADVWEIDGSKVYYTGGNVGVGPLGASSEAGMALYLSDSSADAKLGLHSESRRAEIYCNTEGTLGLDAGVGSSHSN